MINLTYAYRLVKIEENDIQYSDLCKGGKQL